MFVLAFVGAYVSALRSPEFVENLVAEVLLTHIKELGQDKWNSTSGEVRNIFASFVMMNNIMVAFKAFAWGIMFMVGTVYILVFNGLYIGAIAGLCHVHGVALSLWSFVSPHGYIELTTIFIKGGAGMKLGYSLIAPATLTRKQTLVDAAKTAIKRIVRSTFTPTCWQHFSRKQCRL